MLRRCLLALWLTCASALACAQIAVPALAGRVTDLSGVLSADAKQDLDTRLAAIERSKGSQVAILIVPSVQPEDIAAFGIRVADAWKLGRAGVDDGAIIIVALQDRVLRIEVGRGLEGAIPDVIAKRIVSDDIAPRFKAGDFHGGLALGVSRLAERIGAETLPPPASTGEEQDAGLPNPLWVFGLFFVILAMGTVFGDRSAYYSSGGRRSGGVVLPPGGGWGGGGFGGGRGGGGGFSGGGGGFGGGGASGGW